jgi:hypothetical protein
MKNLILLAFVLFLFSCGENKKTANTDSLRTDSALRAQANIVPPAAVNTDTTQAVALPPVFEGDIVMQISDNPQHVAFGKACGSKYNHVGIIFIRPRDRMYVVMELNDSVTATALTAWKDRGQGGHIALLRLKNSNQLLNEKKTERLKKGAKGFRGVKQDYYYSWSDDALYSTELVWKMYNNALKISICEPGTLGEWDLTGLLMHGQLTKKYGTAIPKDEKVVSPDAIYRSSKLEVIYEK